MNKSINDKILPNITIMFLCTILLIAILLLSSSYFLNTLTSRRSITQMVDEINIYEIPIESIITSNITNTPLEKNSNVHDVLTYISKENDINMKFFRDIFDDNRLYNQIKKELYSNAKLLYNNKTYFSTNESNDNLIAKIISTSEIKNNVSLTKDVKSQITTILSNFIYNADIMMNTNNENIEILYNPSFIIIFVTIMISCMLGLILINKNINTPLYYLSTICLYVSVLIIIYAFIQKALIMGLQWLINNYNYKANAISSSMFVAMIEIGVSLLLLALINRIISKEKFKSNFLSCKKKRKKKKKSKRKTNKAKTYKTKKASKKKKSIKKMLKYVKYKIKTIIEKIKLKKEKKDINS